VHISQTVPTPHALKAVRQAIAKNAAKYSSEHTTACIILMMQDRHGPLNFNPPKISSFAAAYSRKKAARTQTGSDAKTAVKDGRYAKFI